MQAQEERDKALKQAKRALNYEPVEPSNDTPFLTTTNLMAISIGLENSEQSQGSNDTPLAPSQARTLNTEPDNSSHLDQLLDEYTRLQKNLIDEIHSEQYIIQKDSRKRLEVWVDNAHNDEVRRLTVTYPHYYDENGEFKEYGRRQMHPIGVGGLAEHYAENLLPVDIPDNFESKPTDRTSNISSQRSKITAIMSRPLASEPGLEKTELIIMRRDEGQPRAMSRGGFEEEDITIRRGGDKPLPQQPKPILRKPKDRSPEYSTIIRESFASHPSQPIKEPLQPIDNQAEVYIEKDPLLPKYVVILSTAVNLPDIAKGPIFPRLKSAIT